MRVGDTLIEVIALTTVVETNTRTDRSNRGTKIGMIAYYFLTKRTALSQSRRSFLESCPAINEDSAGCLSKNERISICLMGIA